MDKEKEIEEMARVMCDPLEPCMKDKPCTDCKTYGRNCYTIYKAKRLATAGYGNIEQAVREFAEELKEIFDAKHTAVMANVVRSRVDELIKKRYGMEEL